MPFSFVAWGHSSFSSDLFSPEEFVDNIGRHRITVARVAPTVLRRLLPLAGNEKPVLTDIDLLVSTGSPLFSDEKLEIARKVSPRFCEMYGAAAIGPISVLRPEEISERPASVGRPFSLIDVEIVDENDQPLGLGGTGQLRVRGPSLTSPVQTQRVFCRLPRRLVLPRRTRYPRRVRVYIFARSNVGGHFPWRGKDFPERSRSRTAGTRKRRRGSCCWARAINQRTGTGSLCCRQGAADIRRAACPLSYPTCRLQSASRDLHRRRVAAKFVRQDRQASTHVMIEESSISDRAVFSIRVRNRDQALWIVIKGNDCCHRIKK